MPTVVMAARAAQTNESFLMRAGSILGAGLVVLLLAGNALAGDGCRYPFVWREPFPSDHVCVTPDIRAQAARDNAAAPPHGYRWGSGSYNPT